mgnify:CR=1 FL=1
MLVSVLSQLAVMFLMIGAGYLVRRVNIVSEKCQSDLAEVVLWIALPCSIVESGVLETASNSTSSILWMTGLSLLSYILVILAAEGIARLFPMPERRRGLFACMTVFANTAFVGYPVCNLLLGSKGVFYCSFFNMAFSLFFFTYGVRRISGKRENGMLAVFTRDPGMIATVLMLLIFACQWKPPAFVQTFLSGMSALCTPLSMLVIGCMLTQVNLKDILKEKSYYLLSFIRLTAIPVCTLLILLPLARLGVDKDILFIVIIMCAMPAGSLTAIYAQKYRKDAHYVSGGIMHTMVCFCISLPIIILLSQWMLYGGM